MKKTSVMILAVLTVMVAGGVSFVHGEEGLEDVNMDFLPSPHYEYWHDYGFDTEDTFWRGMGFDEDHPPRVSDIVFYLYGYSVDINDFFDRMGHRRERSIRRSGSQSQMRTWRHFQMQEMHTIPLSPQPDMSMVFPMRPA